MTLPNCYRCKASPCRCADGITLIHGDCREVLPLIEPGSVDLVLTDPPYGTGWVRGGGGVGEFNAKHEQPEWDVWSTDWIRGFDCYAIFCPASRIRDIDGIPLWYHKTNPRPNGPTREAIIVKPTPWKMDQWEVSSYNGDSPLHPCQKPILVMNWLIAGLTEIKSTILDPFAGSGTTLRAAKDLGRRCIGIEIEEKYVKICAERLKQETMFGLEANP